MAIDPYLPEASTRVQAISLPTEGYHSLAHYMLELAYNEFELARDVPVLAD